MKNTNELFDKVYTLYKKADNDAAYARQKYIEEFDNSTDNYAMWMKLEGYKNGLWDMLVILGSE